MDDQSHNISPAPLPQEIRGWNWGAFFLNWIWGIGNDVWIALLCLIPCVSFIMPFVLGAKGNEWAWKNGKWQSIDHFKKVQRTWSVVGVSVFAAVIAFAIFITAATLLTVSIAAKKSDAYQDAFNLLKNNTEAVQLLGEPVKDGFLISGSIKVSGPSGNADFSFPVEGPKGEGKVYVNATKHMGKWHFNEVVFEATKPAPLRIPLLTN